VTGLQARTEAATRYKLIALHGEEQGSAAARGIALIETKLRSAGIHIPNTTPTDRAVLRSFGPATGRDLPSRIFASA
jgi:hypothetical protein